MAPMLRAQNITFSYRANGPAAPVVRDLTLDLAPGQLVCMVGPNGCGKSTTLKLLAGLLAPTTGTVVLADKSIATMRAQNRAQHIAYVPQRTDLAFTYTVHEYVSMGTVSLALSATDRRARIADAMKTVSLADNADRPVHELSVGNRQRATLARALTQLGWATNTTNIRGSILLADEPTSAMDPNAAEHTMKLLKQITHSQSPTALVVSHDVSLALRWADRIIVQDQSGTLAADDTPANIVASGILDSVFGIRLRGMMENGSVVAVAPSLEAEKH